MYSYFELLLKKLYLENLFNGRYKEIDGNTHFSESKLKDEYRQILDKVAMKMIYNTFENDKIIEAMMNLARLERIILTFNIVFDMELSEIAYLLDTKIDSVYTQKGTALKRLKKELKNVI